MTDLAVVGLGLIGSAALRHAAADATVLGIGPAEPTDWANHEGPFASHYDSGRITRGIDARREWATLALRSIDQYRVIEQASGIGFHRPTGVVFVRNDLDGIERVTDVARHLGLDATVGLASDELEDQPQLSFPAGWTSIREPAPAGAIDPRAMLTAQLAAASKAGATIVSDAVVSIRPGRSGFELLTAGGQTHQAREVLISAGAYSGRFFSQPLAMVVRPEAIVMGEVSPEQAESLAAMPSILYLIDHPTFDDVYVVPPALYPDGKWYVKIGGSRRSVPTLVDDAAMDHWMRSSDALDEIPALRDVLTGVLTGIDFLSWHAKPCLITDTASGLPYIDRVDDAMTVAFGGNGHAAKSADAIGALGAALALGGGAWPDDELPPATFSARFGTYKPPAGSRHGT